MEKQVAILFQDRRKMLSLPVEAVGLVAWARSGTIQIRRYERRPAGPNPNGRATVGIS